MNHTHLLLALFSLPGLLAAQDVLTGTITHEGLARSYRLYIPPASAAGNALPLVFNFHGYGSNATQQQFYSGMDAVADTAGFFVCYPNGIGAAWNVGWEFGSTADDVGFTDALIDTLSESYHIDPQRIYACGMSNGGFMSHRLACELNGRIAAVASVTGSLAPGYIGSCSPGRAVPIMEIHGTADDVVPYEGQNGLCVPIDTAIHFWASNNGCSLSPMIQQLPDADPADGSTITRIDYNDCAGGSRVSLLRVNGGGHTWPGTILNLGAPNQDINASVEIWRFFLQFTLGGTPSPTETASAKPPLKLYPNPTSGLLWLDAEAMPAHILVYNAFGQLIRNSELSLPGALDFTTEQPGLYFVEVKTTEGRTVFRVVKE